MHWYEEAAQAGGLRGALAFPSFVSVCATEVGPPITLPTTGVKGQQAVFGKNKAVRGCRASAAADGSLHNRR